jgi:membrane-associated phospholipid phosphatase
MGSSDTRRWCCSRWTRRRLCPPCCKWPPPALSGKSAHHLRRRAAGPVPLPSRHTLHAVAFTTIALGYYPQLFWLLFPFTLLVALSRMVLGLHNPGDVLAGILLGVLAAGLTLVV